jgi:hypothetical protein
MSKGNASQIYLERQSVSNTGEDLFIEWAKRKGYKVHRLGFDEKAANVDNFYNLNFFLRNIPDFVITKEDKIAVVNVKGSPNMKMKEVSMLPNLMEIYSSKNAPLFYAFCFIGVNPIFKRAETVIELWNRAKDKTWHDGVVYRRLNLEEN